MADPLKTKRTMITTLDNPYSPFTEFAMWFAFDESKGYHTSSLLGRMVVTSNELSESDYDFAVESAIDDMVRLNITGKYIKVVED